MDIKNTAKMIAGSLRTAFKGFTPADIAEAEKLITVLEPEVAKITKDQAEREHKELLENYAMARAQARRTGDTGQDRVQYIVPLTKKGGWFRGFSWAQEDHTAYGETAVFSRCYPALGEALTADGVRLPNEEAGGLAAHPHIDPTAVIGGSVLRHNAMANWSVAPAMFNLLGVMLERVSGYAYLVIDVEVNAVERKASKTAEIATLYGRAEEVSPGKFVNYPVTDADIAKGEAIAGLYLNVEITRVHDIRLVTIAGEARKAVGLAEAMAQVAQLPGIRGERVARTNTVATGADAAPEEQKADMSAAAAAKARLLVGKRDKQ